MFSGGLVVVGGEERKNKMKERKDHVGLNRPVPSLKTREQTS